MRGLTKGEQSTAANAVLQLIVRNRGLLVDPVTASYVIDDVHIPNTSSNVVTTTAVDLTDANLGGDRLGIGRFVINTGATSTWNYGTHRAVVTYKLETSGPSYTQIIEFEVLSAAVYPTGAEYVGYIATRDLYDSGLFAIATRPPETLHKIVAKQSRWLENITQRFFEPRYVSYYVDGTDQRVLFLNEAIVAIDSVTIRDFANSSLDLVTLIESGAYTVYNRHLDGLLNPDDRFNPCIVSQPDDISAEFFETFLAFPAWPEGRQNLIVSGVFGYTDPTSDTSGVSIGVTPADLSDILLALIDRAIADPAFGSLSVQRPGTIRGYKTRDQSIQYGGIAGASSATMSGWTGDPILDMRIARFCKPANLGYCERSDTAIVRGWY